MEGTWSTLKWTAVPIRHRHLGFVEGNLCKFIWTRRHEVGLWAAFLNAISRVIFEGDDFRLIDREIDDRQDEVMEEYEEV